MSKEDSEIVWDEDFLANLPAAGQRRLIRLTCHLIEAEICQEYGLPAGSLLEKLPDPLENDIGPEAFRDEAELAALATSNPLNGKTDAELLALYQEQIAEEETRGEEEE